MTVVHKGPYADEDYGLFIEKDSILYLTITRRADHLITRKDRRGYNLDTIPGFNPNTWYHIVVIKNGQSLASYINGVQGHGINMPTTGTFYTFCEPNPCPPQGYPILSTLNGGDGPFTIGYRPPNLTFTKTSFNYQQFAPLTANLDALRLYSAALTAANVNSLYTEFVPTGRNGSTLQARLQAYPSPATDRLELRSSRSLSGTVQVLNAAGQQVLTTAYSGTAHTLQVATLAPGIYTLHLQTAEGSQSLRFVKQ
jgi:hypothetical protein